MDTIVWGVNSDRPSMTEYLIRHNFEDILFIVDNNPALWGTKLLGKEIASPERVHCFASGSVKIIIATRNHIDTIREQARNYGHDAVSFVRDMKTEYAKFILEDIHGAVKDETGYLPKMLHINFTEVCNLRCIWCYFHGLAGKEVNDHSSCTSLHEISMETLAEIVNNIREIHSIETLCYATAGELFMSKNWFEQVSYVLSELPQIQSFILTTNGMLLNEKNIEKLFKLAVPQIALNISIDGNSPEETERYRVNSSYNKIKQNIQLLQSRIKGGNKIKLYIQSRHPLQRNENPFSPYIPQYLRNDFPDIPCSAAIVATPDLENICFSEYGLESKGFSRNSKNYLCQAPFMELYFDYLGNMRMCPCGQFSHQIKIGDTGRNCIETWQNSEVLQTVRQQFLNFESCKYCGHCPSQNIDMVHYLCET